MFQLVRRARPATPTQHAEKVVEAATSREKFLSQALISLLGINIFILSGTLTFCVFTFWGPGN